MSASNGRIEPAAVFNVPEVADEMFHADTDTLISMYRKGGELRAMAGLELGRRAVNKQAKKSAKGA